MELAGEGEQYVQRYVAKMNTKGLLPCIAADIWSENGVSLFAILAYWIDDDYVPVELMIDCIPFGHVRHTGSNIEVAMKTSLAHMGVGLYERNDNGDVILDTVGDNIHRSNTDSASSMMKATKDVDGHECIVHLCALAFAAFYDHEFIVSVKNKLKGLAAHFSRSNVAKKALSDVMLKLGMRVNMPPKASETRWNGMADLFSYFSEYHKAISAYDVIRLTEAGTAVDNPDGSTYGDHQLDIFDWDVVHQCVPVMEMAQFFTTKMQETNQPTASLIMPYVSVLIQSFAPTTPVKSGNVTLKLVAKVAGARDSLHQDLCERFFTNMQHCKVEDFAVATLLDPRYKHLQLPLLTCWMNGTFSKGKATSFFRTAYANHSPPAPLQAVEVAPVVVEKVITGMEMAFMELSAGTEQAPSGVHELDEFETYLNMHPAPVTTDILAWWRNNEDKLPTLAKMFRQFLALPASTAGVERLFSGCGRMHDDFKKATQEKTLKHACMARYAPI